MKSSINIEQSIRKLSVESSKQVHSRILDKLMIKLEKSKIKAESKQANVLRLIIVSKLAAACLIVGLCLSCFVLSQKNTDLKTELELAKMLQANQNVVPVQPDNSATINLYLKEHKDVIAQHVSYNSSTPQPAQMRVNQHDILYYEFINHGPGGMPPGIIVRGPSSAQNNSSVSSPVISNGHELSLSQAKQTVSFNLVSPSWLHPGYALDQISSIEGRDALHLLYSDGINSVSLFEQSLNGQRALSRQDFREYAVYRNKELAGGTILAWKDGEIYYVLIGNAEMSHLMDMAQSISAAN